MLRQQRFMTKHVAIAVVIVGIMMGGFACTPKKIASSITSQIFVSGAGAMEAQEDPELARTSLVSLIHMLEVMRADNPTNDNFNLLLARSYGNYAYAFFEQELLELSEQKESEAYRTAYKRADLFYSKGRDYGLAILNKNKAMAKALTSDLDTFRKTLGSEYSSKSDVPALYWTAFNWANWVNLHKDSPLAVAALGKVELMMQQALALNPDYFYGGIHQFFGAYYASRPAMLGGSPKKSKASFEQAVLATNGQFLLAKVLYAQYYAVAVQDRTLYEQLLEDVLATDPAVLPEERLGNEIAHRRARTLLLKITTYF